ncbi:ribulose 1,5-bisphosphate synthetase/thiazole synthase [Paraburkholderia sp. GAS448]
MNTATKMRQDHEVDFIIIGTGAADMSAAFVSKNSP